MKKSMLLKTWKLLSQPDEALQAYRDESPRETFTYLAGWSVWLGILTAVTNLLGFPCNLLNSGTNPQLFAYHDIAPTLE